VILTNEISKTTFGVPIKDHKEIKGLDPKFKNQNLRDHMTDLELIFTMLRGVNDRNNKIRRLQRV